jgi:phosphohistidine phosphatase
LNIYLVQHGEAKDKKEDPERPLTDKGKEEVKKMAIALSIKNPQIDEILHSTKLRAKQTAEIFAEHLNIPAKEIEGIKPLDDPRIALNLAGSKNLMIVGHLPHLDNLSSLLLTGDENAEVIKFRMGGVVCLEKEEKWRIKWILVPELVHE